MADTITVSCTSCTGSCTNTCTGTCVQGCRSDCTGTCVGTVDANSSENRGIFGYDDDKSGDLTYDKTNGPSILGTKPKDCKTCTSTCMTLCGNDCEGGCSQGCIDTCGGDCNETCTLGCTGSCNTSCNDKCGNGCSSSCKIDCNNSCSGICQGCTGCTNSCDNSCEQQCVLSCATEASDSKGNGGMLDFSNDQMAKILRSLRWKKISDFPLSPTILNEDKFAIIDDESQTEALDKLSVFMTENNQTNSLDAMNLNNMDMPVSDYSLKTVRVTAAEFVEYLSKHLKNFIVWLPKYDSENHKLTWVREVDSKAPDAVDLRKLVLNLTTVEPKADSKGLMSGTDKMALDELVATDFATQKELDDYKIIVTNEFTKTSDDFKEILKSYVTETMLKGKLGDFYIKKDVDDKLATKSNADHNHDDVYLKISDYNSDLEAITDGLDSAFKAIALSDTTSSGAKTISDEKFPESDGFDHITVTKKYTFTSTDGSTVNINIPHEYNRYRLASSSYAGLMSKEHYASIKQLLVDVPALRADVPTIVRNKVKISELTNDAGYISSINLPIATDSSLGTIKVANDSRISVDSEGFIDTKDFSAYNMLRNSTFASDSSYWSVNGSAVITSETTAGTDYKYGMITMPIDSFIQQRMSAMHDRYMTLSFDSMTSGNFVINISTRSSSATINVSLDSTTWKHYSYIFDLKNDSLINEDTIVLKISNVRGSGSDGITLCIKNIMLQSGMYDTGWVPNPYDGNSVRGYELPFIIDDKTIVNTNGTLSSPSEIDDSPLSNSSRFSSNKTFSNSAIKSYIPLYIGNNQLNMTKRLRFTSTYNNDAGYGLIIEKGETSFNIRATNIDSALSDEFRQIEVTDSEGNVVTDSEGNVTYMVDIPLRIDLQSNKCHINGTAMASSQSYKSIRAKCDDEGNEIRKTYLKIDDFNKILKQINDAIAVLNGTASNA